MKLVYKNKEIEVTQTHNNEIIRYKIPKLRYAIIVYNCNSYGAIARKQKLDMVLVDDNFNIISYRYSIEENNPPKDLRAKHLIILPLQTFNNLERNTKFTLKY